VCAALAVLSAFFFFDSFASRFRMAPAYQVAQNYLLTSEEVHEAVGPPVRLRRYPRGRVDQESGSAELHVRIVGKRAAAKVNLQVLRIRVGDWRVVEAQLTRGDSSIALTTPAERQLDRAASRVSRALVLLDRGLVQEAMAELTAAEREDPSNAKLYSVRGHLHRELQDHAAAAADFRTACSLGHTDSCPDKREQRP
jgi:tetratricopeptide (TPR) repeat protein